MKLYITPERKDFMSSILTRNAVRQVEEDVTQQIDAFEDVELGARGEEGTGGEEEVHREVMLAKMAQRDVIASVCERTREEERGKGRKQQLHVME